MSPSLTERLVVHVVPDRLIVERWSRGFRPRITARNSIALDTAEDLSGELIRRLLQSHLASASRRIPTDVVVSNCFVQYAVVPWADDIAGQDQAATLVKHVFDRQFGVLANSWELRWSEGYPGSAALACGMDKRTLIAIREGIGDSLRSVTPALMHLANARQQMLAEGACALMVLERQRLTLALLKEGRWDTVVGRAIDEDDHEAPTRLVREQLVLREFDEPGTIRYCQLMQSGHRITHPVWRTSKFTPPFDYEPSAS